MTRFALTTPVPGARSGEVEVSDREVTIRHPFLHGVLQLPLTGIAGVHDGAGPDLADGERKLTFAADATEEPTVTLVLAHPVLVIGFKRGAEGHLAISSRERRNGVEVDAIGLAVQDETGFMSELRSRGMATDLAGAPPLAALAPLHAHVESEAPSPGDRRGVVGPVLALGAVLLVTTALLSSAIARIESPDLEEGELGLVIAIALASLAWTVVIAAVVAAWPGGEPEASVDEVDARRRRRFLVSMLAITVVPVVLFLVLQSDVGDSKVARIVLGGLLVGVVNGVLVGVSLRLVRRRRRATTGPVSPPR